MGRIDIESARSLALVFGEASELEVLYTEQGAPVPGTPIRFALEGRAHDSSVSQVVVATDGEGRARTSLVASSTAAVFRVRITAERAAPVYVNVSVGNMGFGSLRVSATYDGEREARSRVVGFYSGLRCDDELPPSFDHSITLDDPDRTEARFPVLPAGLVYAVAGRVLGPSGAVLASACVDGIEIVRDQETRVDLTLSDERLLAAGRYTLQVEVDAAVSAASATDLAIAAGVTRIAASGSPAGLYLDALEAELRERGEDAAADDLAAERSSGLPDATLTTRLADAGADLGVSLLSLEPVFDERLATFHVAGPLSLALDEGALGASWDELAITLGEAAPDSPPLAIGSVEVTASLALGWRDEPDAIALNALQMWVPLGTLAAEMLDAVAAERGHEAPGLLLAEGAGCDVLAGWIAEDAALAASCDEACAQAACVRALDEVIVAIQASLSSVDTSRAAIELSGVLALVDDDADAQADRMSAELEGLWRSPLEVRGDAVRAELRAARVVE